MTIVSKDDEAQKEKEWSAKQEVINHLRRKMEGCDTRMVGCRQEIEAMTMQIATSNKALKETIALKEELEKAIEKLS